ncbi:MAG: hypothetical protein K6B67_06810 [Lachnospiraceae bacterium]|nr:hypothetical protein [Lachnospiraceae bacterium]
MFNNNSFSNKSNKKTCRNCGRYLARSNQGDLCPECSDEEIYAEVKEYILHNNVTELQVAEKFNIPLKQVKSWVKDGRIDYRKHH